MCPLFHAFFPSFYPFYLLIIIHLELMVHVKHRQTSSNTTINRYYSYIIAKNGFTFKPLSFLFHTVPGHLLDVLAFITGKPRMYVTHILITRNLLTHFHLVIQRLTRRLSATSTHSPTSDSSTGPSPTPISNKCTESYRITRDPSSSLISAQSIGRTTSTTTYPASKSTSSKRT